MNEAADLLRRYADHGVEAAFTEFVRGRIDLVYSAALRRTGGNANLAAEAAQQVFLAAARRAHALARHPALTGWLYHATRNAALNLMRDEQRRMRLGRVARAFDETVGLAPENPNWERLRPVLDHAEQNKADAELDRLSR